MYFLLYFYTNKFSSFFQKKFILQFLNFVNLEEPVLVEFAVVTKMQAFQDTIEIVSPKKKSVLVK